MPKGNFENVFGSIKTLDDQSKKAAIGTGNEVA
jgi:hypothetical protein